MGSGGVARRAPFDLPSGPISLARVAGPAVAAALVAVWLIVDPRTPDLAAQIYRVALFKQIGLAVWDEHWYAGHDLPGYSLLFGPLGALLGMRVVGALCALASTVLFGRLATTFYGEEAAAWGTGVFAVVAVGDVWLGRLAFALGVSLALAAGLALARERPWSAGLLSVLCAAASPVAGLVLALAGCTVALHSRAARPALALAAGPAFVVAALALLFPEGGHEPFPLLSFLATAGAVGAFALALPRGESLLRLGAVVYLGACVAFLLVSTPVGSNVERYGVLLGAPLLVCAALRARAGGGPGLDGWGTVRFGVGLCALAVWVLWGPVRETAAVAGSPATSVSFYVPVERFLDGLGGPPVRIEVPLTRSHWEAGELAGRVSLARGWDKQMETRYDGGAAASAASFRRWLADQAVSYVALPDVALDPSSAAEGRLIRGGLPFLREVFADAHWRIYEVLGATPIVTGPGRLRTLGHDRFTVAAYARGSLLVRVHYTRYLTLTSGRGCVSPGPGGWTLVQVPARGAVTVAARFSLAAAFGRERACRSG